MLWRERILAVDAFSQLLADSFFYTFFLEKLLVRWKKNAGMKKVYDYRKNETRTRQGCWMTLLICAVIEMLKVVSRGYIERKLSKALTDSK